MNSDRVFNVERLLRRLSVVLEEPGCFWTLRPDGGWDLDHETCGDPECCHLTYTVFPGTKTGSLGNLEFHFKGSFKGSASLKISDTNGSPCMSRRTEGKLLSDPPGTVIIIIDGNVHKYTPCECPPKAERPEASD